MKFEELEKFGFEESEYERPNQKWVCGHSQTGRCCPLGPDKRGRCRSAAECIPAKKSDRWSCTRSKARGGRCEDGPRPDGSCCRPISKCQPVRSLRARRGLAAWWLTALSVGVIAAMYFGPLRDAFISPGELGFQHGSLAGGCASCHSVAHEDSRNLFNVAMSGSSFEHDSQLCQNCHKLGEHVLDPHSLPPEKLQARHEEIRARWDESGETPDTPLALAMLSTISKVDGPHEDGLACATCHFEHRGKNFDLQKMSNERCQTCHVKAFKSFSSGHPEFEGYPYHRRTRLIFDHSEHFRYFAGEYKDRAPGTSCNTCHHADPRGKTMLNTSFENMCTNCHIEDIRGDEPKSIGLPVITLPALDLDTLRKNQIKIGQWPADVDTEEELLPFTRFLLSAKPEIREALEEVSEIDLLDLSGEDKEVLDQVAAVIWDLKALLYTASKEGPNVLVKRLELLLDRKLTYLERTTLTAHMPANVFQTAVKRWFPNFEAEMRLRRLNRAVPVYGGVDIDDVAESETDLFGRWFQQGFSILYQPAGHRDAFMQTWLTFSSSDPALASNRFAKDLFLELSYKKTAGACGKCHSVDESPDGTLAMNFLGFRPKQYEQKFTKFSHKTHFALLDEKGCQTCHTQDEEADYLSSFDDNDPHTGVSRFASMTKGTCAGCHVKERAGDDCLKCHDYHIGSFPPASVIATLPGMELARLESEEAVAPEILGVARIDQ